MDCDRVARHCLATQIMLRSWPRMDSCPDVILNLYQAAAANLALEAWLSLIRIIIANKSSPLDVLSWRHRVGFGLRYKVSHLVIEHCNLTSLELTDIVILSVVNESASSPGASWPKEQLSRACCLADCESSDL